MKKSKSLNLATLIFIGVIIVLIIVGLIAYCMNSKELISKENEEINGIANSEINETEESNDIVYTEITENLEGIDLLYVTKAIDNKDDTYTLKGVIYTQYTFSIKELSDAVKKGKIDFENKEYIINYDVSKDEYKLYEEDMEETIYTIRNQKPEEYYLYSEAQIDYSWKLTNEYKEITISKDVEVMGFHNSLGSVEEVFGNWEETVPVETTHPDSQKVFDFNFENGKCVEIIQEHLTCI